MDDTARQLRQLRQLFRVCGNIPPDASPLQRDFRVCYPTRTVFGPLSIELCAIQSMSSVFFFLGAIAVVLVNAGTPGRRGAGRYRVAADAADTARIRASTTERAVSVLFPVLLPVLYI